MTRRALVGFIVAFAGCNRPERGLAEAERHEASPRARASPTATADPADPTASDPWDEALRGGARHAHNEKNHLLLNRGILEETGGRGCLHTTNSCEFAEPVKEYFGSCYHWINDPGPERSQFEAMVGRIDDDESVWHAVGVDGVAFTRDDHVILSSQPPLCATTDGS